MPDQIKINTNLHHASKYDWQAELARSTTCLLQLRTLIEKQMYSNTEKDKLLSALATCKTCISRESDRFEAETKHLARQIEVLLDGLDEKKRDDHWHILSSLLSLDQASLWAVENSIGLPLPQNEAVATKEPNNKPD